MCKRLCFLISFVLVLGLVLTNAAEAGLDPNLVGWWKLNETDCGSNAIVYDSSGHGLNGLFRFPATNVVDRYGVTNYAKYFAGTGQYVKNVGGSPPSPLLKIKQQITMAFWFKGRRNPANLNTWEAFIAKGDASYRVSRSVIGNTLHFGLNGTSQGWFDGMTDVNDTGKAEPEWHHVCATYDGSQAALYVDGVLDTAVPCQYVINDNNDLLFFGAHPTESNRLIKASLDNIRIYNRAVKPTELVYVMEEVYRYAYDPTPAEGAAVLTRTPTIKWRPGDGVVSHKVYLDTTKANVTARSGCLINGAVTTDPSYSILSPLAKGTTYYWAIDEVNVVTWKGIGGDPNKVWSFFVASDTASRPDPCDGAQLVYRRDDANQTFGSLNALMSWTQGMSAAQHKVYFDTSSPPTTLRATLPVEDTELAISELSPSITPQYGKKYYWRIDEVNGASTWSGDVWSFTIIDADVGLKGEYYNTTGTEFIPPPVRTRKDLNINFDWGYRSPDPCFVNADNFSVRWTGELEVPNTDTYTFSAFALGEDGIRLWVNERLLIDSWLSYDPSAHQPQIDLVKGRVPIRMEFRETAWGASCKLLWQSPSIPRQIIPIGKFFQPVKAWSANPENGATDVRRDPNLSWIKGEGAAKHDVYFGTDLNKVTDANRTNPLGVLKSQNQDPCTYKPEILEFNTTYYWRVDEVNLANIPPIWKGSVWSFTTGNFLVVDDFESYNPNLADTWKASGNATVSLSTDPVHEGGKAMAIHYNNAASPYYSQASANTTGANCLEINDMNWLKEGVKSLGLWFRGYPDYRGSWSEVGGTHTIIADGADIYHMADEFRYVYTPPPRILMRGKITARVLSIDDTSNWAKAGVMIRSTLEPNSINAAVVVTPGSGVSFQYRKETGGNSTQTNITGRTAPHWVRLTITSETGYDKVIAEDANDVGGAPDKWTQIGTEVLWDDPAEIYRFSNGFYIGLCATSNRSGELCRANISNVTMEYPDFSGTPPPGSLTSQEIGIPYNAPQPMYVVLRDNDSNAMLYYPGTNNPNNADANVTQTSAWTEWRIDLNDFRVQGVDLDKVQKMYIGFGDRAASGGSGTVYIDDIRLYRPGFAAGKMPRIPADIVYDGVINWLDVSAMVSGWLTTDYSPANLYPDSNEAFDQDTFNVQVTDSKVSPGGVTWTADPCGYNNGTWYYYPLLNEDHTQISGWWNVWFYNAPYNPNRWKEIEIELTVEPIVQGSGADAVIIVGGSTGAWAATPNGGIRPPLPSDVNSVTESLYIDRAEPNKALKGVVFNGALTRPRTIKTTIVIPGYNPEWVFIDVRGFNFRIVNGHIRHRCRYDIINFRDFAELGKYWRKQQPWPTW